MLVQFYWLEFNFSKDLSFLIYLYVALQSCHQFTYSPNSSRKSSITPHLQRKNSNSSRSSKQRSEDKISLMESALNDEEEIEGGNKIAASSAEARSRNSSLRNFDLLQVPGNCGLSGTNSPCSGVALSVASFDMDNSVDSSHTRSSNPLGPLSLQIPEQFITPPEANKNCNGNISNHLPLVRMNGGLLSQGEHTSLTISPVKDSQNGGSRLPTGNDPNKQSMFTRSSSKASLSLEDDEMRKHKILQAKVSNGSLYSRLDGTFPCVITNSHHLLFLT